MTGMWVKSNAAKGGSSAICYSRYSYYSRAGIRRFERDEWSSYELRFLGMQIAFSI